MLPSTNVPRKSQISHYVSEYQASWVRMEIQLKFVLIRLQPIRLTVQPVRVRRW